MGLFDKFTEKSKKKEKDKRINKAKKLIAAEKYLEAEQILWDDNLCDEDDSLADYRHEEIEELHIFCTDKINAQVQVNCPKLCGQNEKPHVGRIFKN